MPTVILKKKPLYFSCKKKLWNGKFTDYGKGLDIKMRNRNYFNNNNMQKGIALATCMAIVMGLGVGIRTISRSQRHLMKCRKDDM